MSMNLFTIASTDQSVFYLGKIFGNIGGVLPVSDGPLLLGLMFKVLNTAALSVGALIVVYTTVAGLLSTASEGEFLGKKWSGMWVPIRTVLGIVGLFPSSGGYCAIQIIIMWLILQGVGFADTLWSAVLNFIDKGGSPYASTSSFPGMVSSVQQDFKNLFTGLVCYESLARQEGVKTSPGPYLCKVLPTDARCGKPIPEFEPGKPFALGRGCGAGDAVLKVCNSSTSGACAKPTSVNCVLCKAQLQAVSEIIPTFDAIAKTFVQVDFDYQNFFLTSDSQTTSDKVPQFIKDFCATKNITDKCCVGLREKEAARDIEAQKAVAKVMAKIGVKTAAPPPNPLEKPILDAVAKCSYDVFRIYHPDASGNNGGPGTVSDNALKDIYMPAIKSYTNDINFIRAAADQYQAVMNDAYLTYMATLPPSATKQAWNREAQRNGWILAGMYYMQITQKSANLLPSQDNIPALKYDAAPNPETELFFGIKDLRNNINAMPRLFKYLNDATGSSDVAQAALSEISEASGSSMSGMLTSFMRDISGSPGKLADNPLYDISLWGYRMMITVQLIFALTVVITALVAGLTATNFLVIGTGMTTTPWYEAFKAAWGFTSPFLMLGMSALFSIGAVLGIYLPLIPYTIFLMGAVGWLMATIEAMVAGPIIALGILSPSGQHELLGKSEPAVMIIFNLILRPALMVFGMMASMLLAVVVVTMINQGFAKVAFNIIRAPGLVEGIFFMMAYTSLLVMALNKVFSLIHVIPEKVLTYIGGQAISYGEGEGLQGMKQQMEGGASGVSGAGKEAGAAPAAGITKNAQDKAHEEHEAGGEGVKASRKGRNTTGGNPPQAPPL